MDMLEDGKKKDGWYAGGRGGRPEIPKFNVGFSQEQSLIPRFRIPNHHESQKTDSGTKKRMRKRERQPWYNNIG